MTTRHLPATNEQGAVSVSEHNTPVLMMSVTQHSNAGPADEQPAPPHWPHSATQQTCPSADSIPGMLPVHTSDEKQNRGRERWGSYHEQPLLARLLQRLEIHDLQQRRLVTCGSDGGFLGHKYQVSIMCTRPSRFRTRYILAIRPHARRSP